METAPARDSGSLRFRRIGRLPTRTPANLSRSHPEKRPSPAIPPSVRHCRNRSRRTYRRQRVRSADTAAPSRGWRVEVERELELARELGPGPELDLEWEWEREPAPTTSHTALPPRPKLPGISSRVLLEIQLPAASGQLPVLKPSSLPARHSVHPGRPKHRPSRHWVLATGYWQLVLLDASGKPIEYTVCGAEARAGPAMPVESRASPPGWTLRLCSGQARETTVPPPYDSVQ